MKQYGMETIAFIILVTTVACVYFENVVMVISSMIKHVSSTHQHALGTQWRNLSCQSVGSCQNDYYLDNNGGCKILPYQCPPSTNWQGDHCEILGNMCPNGTFYNNNR